MWQSRVIMSDLHDEPASVSADGVAVDVLLELLDDREQGVLRDLEHYLDRHPGHAETVARCYLEVLDASGAGGQDSATEAAGEAEHIGDFRLLRELGRGGQGVVYLAEDEGLRRQVALKVLHRGVDSADAALRFQREAELTGKIDHPAICTVYATGRHEGRDYIAMRYVAGHSLAEWIRRTDAKRAPAGVLCLPPQEDEGSATRRTRSAVDRVLEFVERIARALHAAHEAGIIHRDVKPSNVLVTHEGDPVILDFGLARDQTHAGATLTASGDVFGTPAYMSPEQVGTSNRGLDARTDVYSLGVVLYECLTLQRPFEGATIEAVVAQIRTRQPPALRRLNRTLPRDVEVVVATALERDLQRRYQTAQDLAEDLRRVRQFEPIRARPAGPLLRLRRWAQRKPALAASLAIALIAVVTIAIITITLTDSRDVALREMQRISDTDLAERLMQEERDVLWPVGAALVPACDEWIARGEQLVARRPEHAALLERLREVRSEDGTYADESQGLLDLRLTELMANIDRLSERVPLVHARRERSLSLRDRSVETHAQAWAACSAAVATSPHYGGLVLQPQSGLVPLGENAHGLWEFWHVESGPRPDWDASRGALPGERSGVALVLLPGGEFAMGSHPTEGPNLDRASQQNEYPPHVLTLQPFFLSKFEFTQAQWAANDEARNPSGFPPGYKLNDEVIVDATHPVEQVDGAAANDMARRLGMLLPTEAQWEYACRAGTPGKWSWGEELDRAGAHGNFHGSESNAYTGGDPVHDYGDLHVRHGAAGSYAPNPFGLHDLHGNVFEWCRDMYTPYSEPAAEGDGERAGTGTETRRVARGGSFRYHAIFARSGQRVPLGPEEALVDCGFRPARALDGR